MPFVDQLSDEDKIRLRLRETQQKLSKKDGAAPTALPTLPGVHALSFATRYIDGGRPRFIEYVQLAMLDNHPAACAWYAVYADLNAYDREHVSLDDVCAASGVRPKDLMSVVVAVAMDYGTDVGNLIAAVTHPEVVRQAAKSAKRIGGDHASIALEDRRMLFQHHNFIPVPRSMAININASASAAAAAAATQEPTVPSFVDDIRRVRQVGAGRTAQAALPAGGETSDPFTQLLATAVPAPVGEPAVLISPDPSDDESQ